MKSKLKTKKSKIKKQLTYISCITLDVPAYDFFLVVDKDEDEIEEFLKKNISKSNPNKEDIIKELMDNIDLECSGIFVNSSYNVGLLNLKKFDGSWFDLDVLNHEIFHMVDFISKNYYFKDESEFKAYMMEGVFRKLRRLLYDELD